MKEIEDINSVIVKLLQESNKIKENLRKLIHQHEHKMAKQSRNPPPIPATLVSTIPSMELCPLPIPTVEYIAAKNGHVFSFEIINTEGCEVRVTCFDEIAQLHSDRVEVGANYVISKGSIKEANTRYNKLNMHLEIILSDASILKCCTHDDEPGQVHSPFIPIREVVQLTNNTLVDIIGVVVHIGDIILIHGKDGSETNKQVVRINDLCGSTIDVNLWGPPSEQRGQDFKNMLTLECVLILVLCKGRVGYFNGKVVNMTSATTLNINPTFPEAEPLMLRGNISLHTQDLSAGFTHIDGKYTRMTISSIHERMTVKPETIQTTLLVVLRFVNVTDKTFYYAACPLKVNGKPYAIGTIWETVFDEVGTQLIKKTTKELCALQNDATMEQTHFYILNTLISHRYSFTMLVSTDTYNSEPKIKVTINKICSVDYKTECDGLLAEIARLSTQA
ncbi:replication protein A 70 kDa DNA-binding subunit A-like [Cryptomeria japonica]|uniref:replication protein A 70 kDa DNA-binding subunit A-like n=1 Tax=Cryptomeria japonica TaxID=3369 RepID=UPI0027DA6AB7|nr:replication protein A 70 kDa DNA-binding subunit A-like [Cryptomeria japonica]